MACGAVEQSSSQLIFQLAYQNAQARRGDEECYRCARETVMLRSKQEGSELPRGEIDHRGLLINLQYFRPCNVDRYGLEWRRFHALNNCILQPTRSAKE